MLSIKPVYDGKQTAVTTYVVVKTDNSSSYEVFRGTWHECNNYISPQTHLVKGSMEDLKGQIENLIARLPFPNPYPKGLVEWVAGDIVKLVKEQELIECECGHHVPADFAVCDSEAVWTCMPCYVEILQEQIKDGGISITVDEIKSKADDYAKDKHKEEYSDPAFAPDVQATVSDYLQGYKQSSKDRAIVEEEREDMKCDFSNYNKEKHNREIAINDYCCVCMKTEKFNI